MIQQNLRFNLSEAEVFSPDQNWIELLQEMSSPLSSERQLGRGLYINYELREPCSG